MDGGFAAPGEFFEAVATARWRLMPHSTVDAGARGMS